MDDEAFKSLSMDEQLLSIFKQAGRSHSQVHSEFARGGTYHRIMEEISAVAKKLDLRADQQDAEIKLLEAQLNQSRDKARILEGRMERAELIYKLLLFLASTSWVGFIGAVMFVAVKVS